MRFLGRLFLADAPERGLDIVLLIEKSSIVLETGAERLGTWPIELVDASRATGDLFDLTLGDESFRFEPRDRLSFAYDGLQAIADRSLRRTTGWRGRLQRIRGPRQATGEPLLNEPTPPGPAPASAPDPPGPDRAPVRPLPNPTPMPPQQPAPGPPPEQAEPAPTEDPATADIERAPDEAPPTDKTAAASPEESEPPSLPADPFDQDAEPEVTVDLRAEADDPGEADEGPLREAPATEQRVEDRSPQKTGSRVSLLDRVRRSRDEHVHTYRKTTISGGLVRRVCTECHHVSIGVDQT